MKKVIFGALALSMIGMYGCQKEEVEPRQLLNEKTAIVNTKYLEDKFISNLQQKIDSTLNNNLIITHDIQNEYTDFAIDNKNVIRNMYNNNEQYETIQEFHYDYMTQMYTLGYSNAFLEPYDGFSIEFINNCKNGQIVFQTELNNYFDVTSFSDRVFHTIYEGMKNCSNNLHKKTIINSAYELIISSKLFNSIQKNYFKRGLTISYYLIGGNTGDITATWYDCLGFVASAVGTAISGPFGAGLGIIGMATSAPGCEESLGW